MDASILQVVWEQKVNWRECINVFGSDYCIEIKGTIRITHENGNFYLEIDAFGQRWKYNLTSACFPFYELGIARFKLCAQPRSNGARLVLEGCIGVNVLGQKIEKCWVIFAQDVVWFNIAELDQDSLEAIGGEDLKRRIKSNTNFGSMSSPLDYSATNEILSQ